MSKDRLDAYMDAMMIVAKASGGLKMTDFSAETWKMLCSINASLARAAAAEAEKLDAQ